MNDLEIGSFGGDDISGITLLNDLHYQNNDLSFTDYFRWKFLDCPHGPARILVCKDMKKDGLIVGKTVGIPKAVKIGPHEVTAGLMTDILVHPDYRGRGIAPMLASALYKDCKAAGHIFSYAMANSQSFYFHTQKLKTRVAGEVPLLVRLIDPRGFSKRFAGIPMVHPLLAVLHKGLQFFRTFSKRPWKPADLGFLIKEIDRFDAEFNIFWKTVEDKRPVMIKRNAEYLQWRFGDVPHRRYRKWIAAEKQSGQIRGYIVTRIMDVNRIQCGMIADLVLTDESRGLEAGELLLTEAMRYFKEEKVAISGCLMMPGTMEFDLLRSCGHFVCPKRFQPQPFPVIQEPQTEDTSLQSYIRDLNNWFFTMGDYDVV